MSSQQRRSSHRLLRSIPGIGTALRTTLQDGYGAKDLRRDVMAGLTVGTVAVPLSMALAIATGVPPQHGLYTAIVAGAIIALTGGARFNVSGPTAAFVVILFPIVANHGLGGLLIASMMAGLILVALGFARMGRLIEFVPYPVILGFTSGIAVVIATMQIPDFFGIHVAQGENFIANLADTLHALPSLNPYESSIGILSLAAMLVWPKLRIPIPAPLIGLFIGSVAAWMVNHWLGGSNPMVETIASRFTWTAEDGTTGHGIPPIAPSFELPWQLPGADNSLLTVNFELVHQLLGPAVAIAMLGAIESLLCAVVADGLTKTRHDPNAELIGQGLGNLIAPLFGGITATAALARTATNIRSGAHSPVAATIHSLVVLLAVIALAKVLGMVPMASLAALLFIIAWNMSEVRHFMHTLRSAPPGDVAILVTCFGLTVLFDMVLAVAVGIGLAAALFIHRMALVTQSIRVETDDDPSIAPLPDSIAVYDINGPLFFAVAEKALVSLRVVDPKISTVIVDMHDVPSIDGTAIVAFKSLIDEMHHAGVGLILTGLPSRMIVKLRRAGIRKTAGRLSYARSGKRARAIALQWQRARNKVAALE